MEKTRNNYDACEVSRRGLMAGTGASAAMTMVPSLAKGQSGSGGTAASGAVHIVPVSLTINGKQETLELDTRTTLLAVLR